jgi:hypothetical protein
MPCSVENARRYHLTHDRLRRDVEGEKAPPPPASEEPSYSLPKAGDTLADAIAVLFIMLGGAVLIAFASTIGG